ncbi:hypothetical protein PY365_19425 [Roseiarcaceae bacterium H3SJ34-1]|uniref:hypothetical protein n=1 Tax=Terripilifer ovatus TaxID=3032367 RepID=UPI003AB92B52|nr:hypothetical protein [Roseiarcaceae bacterium H3SJ34-1]
MGLAITIVDSSSPEQIAKAIRTVNQTPGLRIQPGIDALWALYNAPGHSMKRSEIDDKYGAFDLHFGWFCRRVAEELGANNPDVLALVDYSDDNVGTQILTLKPSVVAALSKKPK